MKLSKETLDVLKNYSSINPNLVVKQGNTLTTLAEAKNIMAETEVPEVFNNDFGVYDLNEFLSAYTLIDDPTLEFGSNSVNISGSGASVIYRFSNIEILTSPTKEIVMPTADVQIQLDEITLGQLRRAASALGHSTLSIKVNNGVCTGTIFDPENSSSNTYSLDIEGKFSPTVTADIQFLMDNLKLLPGNYDVSISSKGLSQWNNINNKTKYWIALEKSSTFN